MAVSVHGLIKWRDDLIELRLSGAREFHDQNGEKIIYKSDLEMATALAFVDKQIAEFYRAIPKTINFNCTKGITQ